MFGNLFKMIEFGDNYVRLFFVDFIGFMCFFSRRLFKVIEDY